jgi:lipopolysaccharide/colanic/teichoic acid biosynthesis glycosyltransferase
MWIPYIRCGLDTWTIRLMLYNPRVLHRKQAAEGTAGVAPVINFASASQRLRSMAAPEIKSSPALSSLSPQDHGLPTTASAYLHFKRGFDIVNATLQLLLFSPLMLLVAVAIKLYDRGPVFFRQARLTKGPDGPRVFNIVKFRTMVIDAERLGSKITGHNDPRITPLGRVLRSMKVDELPQLFNILVGDMSFVGPRPQTMGYVEQFREHYDAIHSRIPAGLTDLASLKYRDESKLLAAAEDPEAMYLQLIMPDKISHHYYYLDHMSLKLDLYILFQTVYHVFIVKPVRKIGGKLQRASGNA